MSGNSEAFLKAAEDVRKLTERPTDQELLELYGLFKQATVGDCNTSKPWFYDLKGAAKWDEWNKRKGTSKDEAETAYTALVKTLMEKYPSS